MSYTREQINELKESIGKGVTKVKHNGKEMEFRSLDEMRKTVDYMEANLAPGETPEKKIARPGRVYINVPDVYGN